ncbi:MAG: TetR/AcrR family transcriptional regulator [Sandaracinaceae bacterium]
MSTSHSSDRAPPERPGPPGGKRDLNRKRRSEQLRQAGLKLFLERGVDPVTIDDIAKEAGTAKGNFYRYFSDKVDLVQAIVTPMSEAVFEAFDRCERGLEEAHDDTSLVAAYQSLAIGLIPVAVGMPDEVRLYLTECRAPNAGARAPIRAFGDQVRERATLLTEFAVDHGLLRIPDPRISALAVVGAVEQLAFSTIVGELDAPPPMVAGILISLVLQGIRR